MREPISYLARPLDNSKIEELTVGLRTKFGNRPINKTNSVSLAIKILREGGILGILADVNAHPKEGVFVPFFTRKEGGTGLGLALVRKVVVHHGGTIVAEDSPLGGARMSITLPRRA